MVNIIDAYRILNTSVLKVAESLCPIEHIEEYDNSLIPTRFEEMPISLSERRRRLDGSVVVAHNLLQYVNKFYSIQLESSEVILLDYLIDIDKEVIDLTEFGRLS